MSDECCPTCATSRATWNAAATSTPRYDPAASFDVESLERSFGGLSRTARREQRRPVRLKVNEYGWGNDGRYYPEFDGVA